MKTERPAISSLENPLYYLENFRTVLRWVQRHHGDLLLASERAQLARFDELDTPAQGLMARMVMRTGQQFRLSKLRYAELGRDEAELVIELDAQGWLNVNPRIDLSSLFRLFTRVELLNMLAEHLESLELGKNISKRGMLEALSSLQLEAAPLQQWAPGHQDTVLEVSVAALLERVSLMFFGNMHQGWSEFVLAELGHQQYEHVLFSPSSRAFQQRSEVDRYLHLSACREALSAGGEPGEVLKLLPLERDRNSWLEGRRSGVLYRLGHQAERQGELELALSAYRASTDSAALVRRLRVLERQQCYAEAHELASSALRAPHAEGQMQAISRVYGRVCKKLDIQPPVRPKKQPVAEISLTLPAASAGQVEQAVADAMSAGSDEVYYVENWLFNSLFGLLCWPALFAPLKGAFFHPFHAAPADLFRDEFVSRREDLFRQCLATLETGVYRQRILESYRSKKGISCLFVNWGVLDQALLDLALECIPAAHLQQVFERMLRDLRNHRAGIPDLIRFTPGQKTYELVEVKAPGDRLQDNQKRWFEFFHAHAIPAVLCKVSWA